MGMVRAHGRCCARRAAAQHRGCLGHAGAFQRGHGGLPVPLQRLPLHVVAPDMISGVDSRPIHQWQAAGSIQAGRSGRAAREAGGQPWPCRALRVHDACAQHLPALASHPTPRTHTCTMRSARRSASRSPIPCLRSSRLMRLSRPASRFVGLSGLEGRSWRAWGWRGDGQHVREHAWRRAATLGRS